MREQHSPSSMAGGSPPRSILDFRASAASAGQAQQGQVCVPWSSALAQLPAPMAGYLLPRLLTWPGWLPASCNPVPCILYAVNRSFC